MVIKSFPLAWLSLKLVNKEGSSISACCGDAARLLIKVCEKELVSIAKKLGIEESA